MSTCIIPFNEVELTCNYKQADLLYMFNEQNSIDINSHAFDDTIIKSLTVPKILKINCNILKLNKRFKYNKKLLNLNKLYLKIEKNIV